MSHVVNAFIITWTFILHPELLSSR